MKKRIVSFLLTLFLLSALFASASCSGPAGKSATSSEDDPAPRSGKVKIVPTDAGQVQYEKFDNGLISFEMPKGWKTQIPSVGYVHYNFKVFDPQNPDRMFFFFLKLEGFTKSEEARAIYQKFYPDSMFARLPAINPLSSEAYFKVWNISADYSNTVELKTKYLPEMNDFTVIENFGASPFGGDILRASFTSEDGKPMQGLFTTNLADAGSYYMYGVDCAPLITYHTVLMSAPEAEFCEWQSVLDHCLATLQFSDAFVSGFMQEEGSVISTIRANQKIYDSISDGIMDSWNRRNASYDIISQKQSDATLGYERVYDVETGDVYRAYNGFTDDYKGERYKPVTDNMYTETISGYIQK